MDLKIKDVAELLNVSETTIRRWLNDGKIPAYKIQGQYRFSRIEIENWVMSHKLSKEEGRSPFEKQSVQPKKSAVGSQKFSLYRALHKGCVLINVPGKTPAEVIANSTKELSRSYKVDPEMLADLLIDRETLQPTALNNGLAVPHTREFILTPHHDLVAVAFPEQPIAYGALDGKPVHSLLFLFAGSDKRHLHLLAKLAHLSGQNAEFQKLLQKKPSKEELLNFVKEWESQIAAPSDEE
ncbi:MAG: PTS sugar transporter subunit IIA [Parachlamydiaceae bacterium]